MTVPNITCRCGEPARFLGYSGLCSEFACSNGHLTSRQVVCEETDACQCITCASVTA